MKHTLEFTKEELNTILFGLQKLPWEVSNAIIQNILIQVRPNIVSNETNSEPAKTE
jgi:hypothetical protein